MAAMDEAVLALAFGLIAYAVIESTPPGWMRAAGGLLIVVTVLLTALQLLGLA